MKALIAEILEMIKGRKIRPAGRWDNGQRWFPAEVLEKSMDSVRYPSRSWPLSYLKHCTTKKFVKQLIEDNSITTLEEFIKIYTSS